MPVLTIWCWNRALCVLDVVGCISVCGCTIVFCVTVCRLCESWSSIRTLVGAKRDGEMPPDSESRNVSHCPQVVSDVACSSKPFASSSSLPSDYDVSNVLDHISWIFARQIVLDVRWKGISANCYHVKRNRHLDYGNLEYVAILCYLCLIDDEIAKFLITSSSTGHF